MKFYIQHPGDPTVGIGADEATLETEVEMFGTNEERQDYIDQIKAGLTKLFSEIFDGKATVMTDEELANMNRIMEEAEKVEQDREVLSYDVMIVRNGQTLSCGAVVKSGTKGWKFYPVFQANPSRKFHETPAEALAGRIKEYTLKPRAYSPA